MQHSTQPRPAGTGLKAPEPEPRIKYVRARSVWEGRMRSRLEIRHFPPFRTGEPERMGGDDSAPTPMEIVIASFNGCLTIVIELVAAELGVPLDSIEMETEATVDQRGIFGTASVSPHFIRVVNHIRVGTTADQESLEEVRRLVMLRCPAYNLIKDAGVPVELHWELDRSVDPASGGEPR